MRALYSGSGKAIGKGSAAAWSEHVCEVCEQECGTSSNPTLKKGRDGEQPTYSQILQSQALNSSSEWGNMGRTLGSLLAFACFCVPAFSQTPEACRSQLRHYTVPEYAKAFSWKPSSNRLVTLPGRFLFSEGGVEVYADTFPDGRNDFLTQISQNGLKVLMVYQEEPARQAMIEQLRDKRVLPPPGMGALVSNLKYAEVLFMPRWLPSDLVLGNKMGNPFDREWQVAHIEYDQPKQCMNVFQNDVHPSLYDAYSTSVWIIAETNPPWINQKLPADRFPIWSKALQGMLAWAKQSVALVDR